MSHCKERVNFASLNNVQKVFAMTDTHIHIERGPYTKEWIDKFVNQAVISGMEEIYLLEHSHRFEEFSPMYDAVCQFSEYQKSWYNKKKELSIEQFQTFITEMREYEYPIKIKWGLEICYFPDYEDLISSILKSSDFDFATGSIHWVNGFGFDHKSEFWNGINIESLYSRYYDLMISLVKSDLFTGLAHPDSIKCFNYLPPIDLSNIYLDLANELNHHNMYAEQSGGLALNYHFSELGMNKTMLDIFRKKNVDIRFASDAHRPEDVGANIQKMMSLFT
jgi:histidinol-phosphatase (PHP family)